MLGVTALTLQFSLFLGLYYAIAGLAGMLNPGLWRDVVTELRTSAALRLYGSVVAFLIGAVIIAMHNRWTGPLPGLVSAIGWAALIKGAVLVIRPAPLLYLAEVFLRHGRLLSLAIFAVGVVLLLLGCFAGTDPYYDALREMA